MEPHEKIYRELKKHGKKGWGGTSFDDRMKGWEEQLEKLFGLIQLKGNRVLEFGSGAGDVSLRIAQRGYQVTGMEISPTAVEWAKDKAADLNLTTRFQWGSVADRKILPEEKYDLIIDGNCLHCLFDEDRIAFFDNMERLIKDGGFAFISSAVLGDEGEGSPKISSLDRCFVPSASLVGEMERRGFRLLENWSSHGTHEHFYGLFVYEKN